jgi:hypothetical protein
MSSLDGVWITHERLDPIGHSAYVRDIGQDASVGGYCENLEGEGWSRPSLRCKLPSERSRTNRYKLFKSLYSNRRCQCGGPGMSMRHA